MFKKLATIIALSLLAVSAFAQLDDPGAPISGSTPAPGRVVGDVVTTFNTDLAGLPVGLEGKGNGFLVSEINNDIYADMSLTGVTSNSRSAGAGNPIGVTHDGSNVYVTDAQNQLVRIFNAAGTETGSFPTTGTTFPEGITYNPLTNSLFVVDGDASAPDSVIEFSLAGNVLNTFPLASSSTDGIAYQNWQGQQTYWVYDSGSDTVAQYNSNFSQVLTSFSGTIAAGQSGGEGVAVLGDVVYVLAAGSNTVVGFEIPENFVIPTLGEYGLMAFIGLLALGGVFMMRKRAA